jgi:hypothetical protein
MKVINDLMFCHVLNNIGLLITRKLLKTNSVLCFMRFFSQWPNFSAGVTHAESAAKSWQHFNRTERRKILKIGKEEAITVYLCQRGKV